MKRSILPSSLAITVAIFLLLFPLNQGFSQCTAICPTDTVSVAISADSCSTHLVIPLDTLGDCGDPIVWVVSGAGASPSFGLNDTVDAVFFVGVSTVDVFFFGENGENVSCTFNVSVQEPEAPVLDSCPEDTVLYTSGDSINSECVYEGYSAYYEFSENCSIAGAILNLYLDGSLYSDNFYSVSSPMDIPSPHPLFEGNWTWELILFDESGNRDSCIHSITVINDEPPHILCNPSGVTISTDGEQCSESILVAAFPFSCQVDSITNDLNDDTDGAFIENFPTGYHEVTFTAYDDMGNTGTCVASFTVVDGTPPELSNCEDVSIPVDSSCQGVVSWVDPIAVDNCSDTVVPTQISGVSKGSVQVAGTYPITYMATDSMGNSSTCTFSVHVDTAKPVIINCPSDIVVYGGPDCEETVSWTVPDTSDNCGANAIFTVSGPGTGNTSPGTLDSAILNSGVHTVTYTLTDAGGNSKSCSFTISVLDTTPPVIACPSDLTMVGKIPSNSTYAVDKSGSYDPIGGTGTEIMLSDDDMSGALPIGFAFDFFNNSYTEFYISSNGFITFSPAQDNGCCNGPIIPDPTSPNNLIAFAWSDLYPPGGGIIEYFTTGSAPNRVLVVNFIEVPHYQTGGNVTVQLQLHEESNRIEIHTSRYESDEDSDRTYTVGIENSNGTTGTAEQGFNGTEYATDLLLKKDDFVAFYPVLNKLACFRSLDVYSIDTTVQFDTISGSGTTVSLGDDHVSGALPIGFPFNFYGNFYNSFYLSSNGFITFSPGQDDGCCDGETIPDPNNPNNLIAFAWSDLYPPGGGTIEYFTTGSAPNRVLVVNFIEVPHFSSGGNVTVQLQLHEGSNRIEIHTTRYEADEDSDRTYTVGIENSNGTTGAAEQGFNARIYPSGEQLKMNEAVGFLPLFPSANDNCLQNSGFQYSWIVSNDLGFHETGTGIIDNLSVPITELNDGSFPLNVEYTVSNTPGNSSICNFKVHVVKGPQDSIPVHFIKCPPDTVIYAADSTCTNTLEYKLFVLDDCCEYLGNVDSLRIDDSTFVNHGDTLRQTAGLSSGSAYPFGQTVNTFIVTDEMGHTDFCTFTVTVLDTTTPKAVCRDHTLQIDSSGFAHLDATDLNNGSTDNCAIDTITVSQDIFDCSDLGVNALTLTVVDESGNSSSCTATITVEGTPFLLCPGSDTLFADTDCDKAIPNYIDQSSIYATCDNILSVNQDPLPGTSLPPGTHEVTITVWDEMLRSSTCMVDLTILDKKSPVLECPAGDTIHTMECTAVLPDYRDQDMVTDNCQVYVPLEQVPSPATVLGEGQYSVTVTATDDAGNTAQCIIDVTVAPSEDTLSLSCPSETTVTLDANCEGVVPDFTDDVTISGTCPDSVELVQIPQQGTLITAPSTVSVALAAEDENGEQAQCQVTLTFRDLTEPEVICQDVSLLLSEGEEYVLSPAEIDNGSTDNCGIDTMWLSQDTFSCADTGMQTVTLTVVDESGNSAACIAAVTVECELVQLELSGHIETPWGTAVEDVTVTVSGTQSGSVSTNGAGNYNSLVNQGADVSLTPGRDIDYDEGISTLDLVIIQSHILGLNPFGMTEQYIAADASNDQNISTFDLVQIQSVLLGLSSQFSSNESWRFVRSDYVFPDPDDPWTPSFPEDTTLTDVQANIGGLDFTGIKIGDVNGSWMPGLSGGASDIVDRNRHYVLSVRDRRVRAGDEIKVWFEPEETGALKGYQSSMHYDPNALKFQKLLLKDGLPGLTEDHFNTFEADMGQLHFNYWSVPGQEIRPGQNAFGLQFEVQAEGKGKLVSQLIELTDDRLYAEAYIGPGIHELALRFDKGESSGFVLYPNRPNPYREETVIAFELPEASSVDIEILDVSGRTLANQSMEGEKGYNEYSLQAGRLPEGVMYYRVSTSEHSALGKMVLQR